LTLVKRLVEMHGGTVEGRSEGAGQGSEFIVRLPLVGTSRRRRENGGAREVVAGPTRCILVVDDNVDAAESLAMMLRLNGHDVRTAHNGLQALEQAETFQPEVILLDLGLPGMDGYEIAQKVRNLRGMEEVFLVALTGWGQEEDRLRTQQEASTPIWSSPWTLWPWSNCSWPCETGEVEWLLRHTT